MERSCVDCLNQNCLIKKNITNPKVQEFAERKRTMNLQKGKDIVVEGTNVQGLFFIYEGIVNVYKTGINGKEQVLRFSKSGEVIGYRGFGSNDQYQIGAECMSDAVMCFFSNAILEEMFLTIPQVTYDFMRFYAEELGRSETKVQKFAQMTVREKVIDTLLYMHRKFGETNGYLNLQLSRKEIAGYAGTTNEQVIRVITALEKEGIVEKKVKRIVIKDLDSLKKEITENNFFLSS